MAVKVIEVLFFVVILVSRNTVVLSVESKFVGGGGMTLPGTKWCGPGNTANHPDDLGEFFEEDKCCRAHDNCEHINPGEMKNDLKNPEVFTRLHCQCEVNFHHCLKSANSPLGFTIGTAYFEARQYCYRKDYPILKCLKYQKGFIHRRCSRYLLDKTKPKKWQWFEIPFY